MLNCGDLRKHQNPDLCKGASKMMNKCGLTVTSRSDSGVISSSVSESALSASDTAASNSANCTKLVLQTD